MNALLGENTHAAHAHSGEMLQNDPISSSPGLLCPHVLLGEKSHFHSLVSFRDPCGRSHAQQNQMPENAKELGQW
jgi:hypothetical protein